MELLEAMEQRHSVRSYEDRPLEPEVRAELTGFLAQCSRESGLHMQLVVDEPEAFGGLMAHYGKFSGVKNYIALVGKKSAQLDELCGYFGEKVVLKAQQMGLNTCWVALTYKKVKSAFQVGPGEKLGLVIAIGYGKDQGVPHTSKAPEAVMETEGPAPDWFRRGGGGRSAGPHRHEPAEIQVHPPGGYRVRQGRNGLLHQGGPGHRQVPL